MAAAVRLAQQTVQQEQLAVPAVMQLPQQAAQQAMQQAQTQLPGQTGAMMQVWMAFPLSRASTFATRTNKFLDNCGFGGTETLLPPVCCRAIWSVEGWGGAHLGSTYVSCDSMRPVPEEMWFVVLLATCNHQILLRLLT